MGILFSLSKPIKRTVENISENVAIIKEFTQNNKMPFANLFKKFAHACDKATRVYSKE